MKKTVMLAMALVVLSTGAYAQQAPPPVPAACDGAQLAAKIDSLTADVARLEKKIDELTRISAPITTQNPR